MWARGYGKELSISFPACWKALVTNWPPSQTHAEQYRDLADAVPSLRSRSNSLLHSARTVGCLKSSGSDLCANTLRTLRMIVRRPSVSGPITPSACANAVLAENDRKGAVGPSNHAFLVVSPQSAR